MTGQIFNSVADPPGVSREAIYLQNIKKNKNSFGMRLLNVLLHIISNTKLHLN